MASEIAQIFSSIRILLVNVNIPYRNPLLNILSSTRTYMMPHEKRTSNLRSRNIASEYN